MATFVNTVTLYCLITEKTVKPVSPGRKAKSTFQKLGPAKRVDQVAKGLYYQERKTFDALLPEAFELLCL